jgi:4-hydroxy 2-oxovalerate aldolase
VITLINDIIYPIYQKTPWGYSPYFYLTARYHCHPNYATYILSKNTVSVTEFEQFLKTITDEYRTKCRKDTALEFFATFRNNNQK